MFEHKERFESKYQCLSEDECWPWLGGGTNDSAGGYGQFKLNGRMRLAHRVSYDLYKGDVPDNMMVLHTCDNRRCVNPHHLRLGTAKDNAQDMVLKGREGQSKLTVEQVAQIKALLQESLPQKIIADRFGISQSEVSHINNGHRWSHI